MDRIEYPEQPPLPPELLKFRAFGEPNSRERKVVIDALCGRLHFSSLDRFNDPFEGRPVFKPRFEDPAEQHQAMRFMFARLLREHAGLKARDSTREADRRLAEKSAQAWVEEFGQKINEALRRGPPWVYCVSHPDVITEPLPWSHYADNHRGLCLHFDTSKPPFALAWPIRYSDEYPVLLVPRSDHPGWEEVERQLLVKHTSWKYEREYRLVRLDPSTSDDDRVHSLQVQWDGLVAHTSPTVLSDITLGSQMPATDKAEVLRLLDDHESKAVVWESRLGHGAYRVERNRIR